ncbi:MAG: sigma-70 family RNA polymerase sigma factor, partial [Terrimonas sp.]|nr:sigma-70 family RNA polymerase sigma factor [Terrimonas sp.]
SMINDGEDLIKTERLKLMYNAIAQLTDVEKALVMLYIEDKTYEEMEDILGMTQGSLRVKMNRIKEKLRKQVSGE